MSYVTTVDGRAELLPLSEVQTNFLMERGIDLEVAIRLGVQSIKFRGYDWLAFPYYQDGEIVNAKFRTLDKKFMQSKGGEKIFYNKDVLSDVTLKSDPLIIFEGEIDCLTAIQCGFPRSISVPDGAPSKNIDPERDEVSMKYSYLQNAFSLLDDCKEIIIATDGDASGHVLRDDLSIRLSKARCKYLNYPQGCKDLNETFLKYGERGVKETIARAKWCKVDGVYEFSELPPIEEKFVYELNMGRFDENFKLRKGDFTVVTGHPSSGKSTFVNHMMCQLVKNHKLKIGFASFEQKPQTDHLRLLRKWFLFEYELFTEGYFNADALRQRRCTDWIDKNFSVIVPSFEDMVDLPWLIEKMQVAVLQKNCDVIVIDPFNELDHDTTGDPMRLYIGQFIKTLKRFASRHDVHVIVVAHPRKLNKDKDGNIEIPNLYDIEESSMWYNKTDLGLIIHRQDGLTLARVAKSRYEDMIGKRGQKLFMFDETSGHFNEYVDGAFKE
jgi:twinkle protein